MTRIATAVGVMLLVSMSTAVCLSELTPEQQAQARALIAQFSDRRFAARQEAVDKLVAMGPDVLPLVRKTMGETKDNEVKLRCELVIKGIAAGRKLAEKVIKSFGKSPPGDTRLLCSLNGEGIAYRVRVDGGRSVVHDGREGPRYRDVGEVALSPDGKRLAYKIYRDGKQAVVCDGKEHPSYDQVAALGFSPDGRRLAYWAFSKTYSYIVCDGKVHENATYWPQFSPDGRHLAYIGYRDRKRFIVVDSAEGPPHDRILIGSDGMGDPGSGVLNYITMDDGQVWRVAVDWPGPGEEVPAKLKERRLESLAKAPEHYRYRNVSYNSRGVVFGLERGKEILWVHRGKEAGMPCMGPHVRFSPDGNRYVVTMRRDRRFYVISDQGVSPAYEIADQAVFSPDSKHLAYIALDGEGAGLILDGKRVGWARASCSWLVFSPDGEHLTCVANGARGKHILCNGRKGPRYDRVWSPAFSPDSRHLCYVAGRDDKWFIVCDGIEGPPHSSVWVLGSNRGKRSSPGTAETNRRVIRAFTLNGAIRYYAVDNGNVRLIEVAWPKDLNWTHGLEPIEGLREK